MLSSDLRLLISCAVLTVIPLRAREILLQPFADFSYPNCTVVIALELGVFLLPLMPALAIAFFKRHGRWKTDRAKDGYIKDKLES